MLTRDDILKLDDITVKEITVPDTIPVWGGKSLFIKQLTRGTQDAYSKRISGETRLKQDGKAKNQEISGIALFGHDSWICVRSICDAQGNLLFKPEDAKLLDEKSGQAIDWVAVQILEFSGMREDAELAKTQSSAEMLADTVKN